MLPSSGYTRLSTVRSSLNLAHAIDGILARVPHEIACYGARVSKRKKKGGGGVIHVKLKSRLRPLGPKVHIRISTSSPASYGIPGWLGLPSIPQPSCPSVYDLVG